MKNCKLCGTAAVTNSELIQGLSCCKMCGSFFFEGMATDNTTLSVGQILREIIKLSGYKDTLFTHDAIHIAAQLKYIDSRILEAFILFLDSGSTAMEKLMKLTIDTFRSNYRSICNEVERATGLNGVLSSYIVDTYAYALALTEMPIDYQDSVNKEAVSSLRIVSFQADKDYIKKDERVTLTWEVNNEHAIVAISDGFKQWCVPSTGSMSLTISKDRKYTITASKGGESCAPKTVEIHVVKPVHISSFKASNNIIYEGQTVNVNWKVSGADRIELLINDGSKDRQTEDVTSLRNKEISLSRDSQITLICSNSCYQYQQIISISVKPAPRLPTENLIFLKHLPEINISGPFLPSTICEDNSVSDYFETTHKSGRSLAHSLLRKFRHPFEQIKEVVGFKFCDIPRYMH